MKKKRTKRVAKPAPLRYGQTRLSYVAKSADGSQRLAYLDWMVFDAVDQRRLSAWLLRAAAWCEEGER